MINGPRARIARLPLGDPVVLSTAGDVHLWVLPTPFAVGRKGEQLRGAKIGAGRAGIRAPVTPPRGFGSVCEDVNPTSGTLTHAELLGEAHVSLFAGCGL